MVGWHHWLNGLEFEKTPGDSEGQGSLECYSWRGTQTVSSWTTTTISWITIGEEEVCNVGVKLYSRGMLFHPSLAGSRGQNKQAKYSQIVIIFIKYFPALKDYLYNVMKYIICCLKKKKKKNRNQIFSSRNLCLNFDSS